MSEIAITVNDQTLTITNAPVIASGSDSVDKVAFTFSGSEWSSYTSKYAVFYRQIDEVYKVALDSNSKATIPSEVLEDYGNVYMGIMALNAAGTIVKTSEMLRYGIKQGSITYYEHTTTPNIYAQIISALKDDIEDWLDDHPEVFPLDAVVSDTSTNAIQNKIIKAYVDAHILAYKDNAITADTDLNSVTTAGKYNIYPSSTAQTISNIPEIANGTLIVMQLFGSSRLLQLYVSANNKVWHRYGSSSGSGYTWESWSNELDSFAKCLNLTYADNAITADTDLNSVTTAGKYNIYPSSTAQTISNIPEIAAGTLIVMQLFGSSRLLQLYITATNRIWHRYGSSSGSGYTWESWTKQPEDYVSTDLLYKYDSYNALLYGGGTTGTASGVTYTKNSDGTWTVTGTASAVSFRNIVESTSALPAYIIPGRYYRLRLNGGSIPVRIYFYDGGSIFSYKTYSEDAIIKIPADADGIIIRFQLSANEGPGSTGETVNYEFIPTGEEIELLDGTKTKIAMFGDSITWGRDSAQSGVVQASQTIPQTVEKCLGAEVNNFGVGGIGWSSNTNGDDDTRIAYDLLSAQDLSSYDVVTLAFGANDSASKLGTYTDAADAEVDGKKTIMGQIKKAVDYIYSQNALAQIVLFAPIQSYTTGSFPTWSYAPTRAGGFTFTELITAMKNFAERYHIAFVDCYDSPTGKVTGTTYSDVVASMFADKLHPTGDGYKVLGKYFAGKIGNLTNGRYR